MQKLRVGMRLMSLHVCMLILEDLNLLIRQMPVCSAKVEDSPSPLIKDGETSKSGEKTP